MSNNQSRNVQANDRVRQGIKRIAECIGVRYLFASMYEANLVIGEGDFPVLIDRVHTSGSVTINQGLFKDAPNCLLFFCDKTNLDYNAEKEQPTIARMKQLAFEFIAEANRSGLFEFVDNATYEIFYDKMDVTVSGVAVSLTLKDAIGVCV